MKHTYATKNNKRGAYGATRLMGRCVRALALVLALVLLASCTPASTKSPSLWISSGAAKPGDTGVQVQVVVEDNPGWFCFVFTPVYDTSRLVLTDTQVNTEGLGGTDPEIGQRIVWLGDDADSTFNGTIITFTFDVLPDAPEGAASVTLGWSEGDVCNYDEEDIYPIITPGYITVSNE